MQLAQRGAGVFLNMLSTFLAKFGTRGPVTAQVIEESATYPGKIEVLELVEGGNAEKAGILPGDLLRGTTAMALNIAESAEEDFGFSVGLTEGTRQVAYLPSDRKSFDFVMAALQSNNADNGGPGEAALVFERRVKEPAAPAE